MGPVSSSLQSIVNMHAEIMKQIERKAVEQREVRDHLLKARKKTVS